MRTLRGGAPAAAESCSAGRDVPQV